MPISAKTAPTRAARAPAPADANRSGELETFVLVAERGSLSAAARRLGVSPSAVSKVMSRLEARLGVQLLQRSTRRVLLTAEGAQYYEQGKRVLADLDELETSVAGQAEPRGLVRITASTSTGQTLLGPLIPRLLAAHPGLRLDLSFTDQVVDLLEAGVDIAIRWGRLPASDWWLGSWAARARSSSAALNTSPSTARPSIPATWAPTCAWAGTTGAKSRAGLSRWRGAGSRSTSARSSG